MIRELTPFAAGGRIYDPPRDRCRGAANVAEKLIESISSPIRSKVMNFHHPIDRNCPYPGTDQLHDAVPGPMRDVPGQTQRPKPLLLFHPEMQARSAAISKSKTLCDTRRRAINSKSIISLKSLCPTENSSGPKCCGGPTPSSGAASPDIHTRAEESGQIVAIGDCIALCARSLKPDHAGAEPPSWPSTFRRPVPQPPAHPKGSEILEELALPPSISNLS